tara:strand:- start:1384 stop:1707 length:324 start_codon:yes stop_codon:yes gene_type:complete
MEITGFGIGFEALVSLLSAIVGALAVWYSLKGKVEIQSVILSNLKIDMDEIKDDKKAGNLTLHKRIDDVKKQVEENRVTQDRAIADLKTEMQAMELRIIQAIHEQRS